MEEREEHLAITLSKIKSKSKFLNGDFIGLFEVPEHLVCTVHCQSKTEGIIRNFKNLISHFRDTW
jgi:hypothetical protein